MGPHNRFTQRPAFAVLVFLFGLLLFSWPLLSVAGNSLTVYLFGVWLLILICLAAIAHHPDQ